MHLEVTAVDPVVVGNDHAGELDVLVGDRLERAVELLDNEVEPVEGWRWSAAKSSWNR